MATEVEVDLAFEDASEGMAEDGENSESPAPENSTTRKRKNAKKEPSEKQSRKPPSNKWLQQQIPACRPVFTALSAFVGFLVLGIAFLIIGSIFTAFSSQLRNFEVFYDDCAPIIDDTLRVRSFNTCEAYLANISVLTNLERRDFEDCHCQIDFTLTEDIRPSWNFYYGMRNYYQNHRRYLNSWDVDQLRGEGFTSPSSDCRPFVRLRDPNDTLSSEERLPVVPCGLIANSWFNDSFDSFVGVDDQGNNITVSLNRTNIAWETDRTVRFRNPNRAPNITADDLVGTVRPPNWPRDLSEIPGGLQNESLMVWFRVSAFPWFKKMYGRPAVNGARDTTLRRGNYSVVLTYNYPVGNFNGRKSIVLVEVNALGGHNIFLGVLYLVVGALLIVTAFVLLLMHKLCSKWKLSKAPFEINN